MKTEPYIYWCADDFGITAASCDRIAECAANGCLNKISVLPNSDVGDIAGRLKKIRDIRKVTFCVHLNFVEGHCVSDKNDIPLLVDCGGSFKNSFTGLLKLSLSKSRKALREQLKTEMKAQISRAAAFFPENEPLFIDSHQHTHMIPLIFSVLCEVIEEERLRVEYLRMPSEPVLPFLKFPSLYPQYISVNLIKQWLLKLFGLLNRKRFNALNIKTACFFGIMFSGNMTEKRVARLLPAYRKYAAGRGCEIEILFHPGYVSEAGDAPYFKNIKFRKFYLSSGRRNEYDALINISEN